MTTMQPERYEAFEDRSPVREVLPYGVGLLLLGLLAWFVYTQLTAVSGVRVTEDSKSVIDVVPLPPPPPPPPPPPELKEKRPEPTEQPQPSPVEAPKAPQPQPQAAPVSINAPAEAGNDAFGLSAGSGGGIGAPSSGGTCLGTHCGAKVGGGGMGLGVYRSYLSSALQRRVSGDDRLNRLVFSADLLLTVNAQGQVSGARLIESRGRDDEATLQRLVEVLRAARLDPPPPAMSFPYKITVRGRRAL
ncbi:TonB-dependent receptor [Sphingomonas gei]|uniref:TonB-dependent receptor n=1 Tax=Sphingomonas gei TaxID=1395960 RepID=A0A4S1WYU2_9SPHN|nr:TonB-dependent receptor [Sphingomonas gei]TGX48721.1 TonB-dependent receptor [Sphingomonas gei]